MGAAYVAKDSRLPSYSVVIFGQPSSIRPELTGITLALEDCPGKEDHNIITDSLSSMRLLKNMQRQDFPLQLHRHTVRQLLLHVAKLMNKLHARPPARLGLRMRVTQRFAARGTRSSRTHASHSTHASRYRKHTASGTFNDSPLCAQTFMKRRPVGVLKGERTPVVWPRELQDQETLFVPTCLPNVGPLLLSCCINISLHIPTFQMYVSHLVPGPLPQTRRNSTPR
jgi:hypothetical protein